MYKSRGQANLRLPSIQYPLLHVNGWVHAVRILLVQLIPQQLYGFSDAISVTHFRKCRQHGISEVKQGFMDAENRAVFGPVVRDGEKSHICQFFRDDV